MSDWTSVEKGEQKAKDDKKVTKLRNLNTYLVHSRMVQGYLKEAELQYTLAAKDLGGQVAKPYVTCNNPREDLWNFEENKGFSGRIWSHCILDERFLMV